MSEVVGIHGGRAPGQPSQQIIETLESLLEEARAGVLVGLGYATVRTAGSANNWTLGTGWSGEAADGLRYRLGSAIHMLDWRYTEAMLRGD